MTAGQRGRGRPAKIDRERILQAALEVAADGEPLSMKAVADRLGVQRPNLYHHVPDREALVAMVSAARIDQVMDEAWMPTPDAGWRAWLTAFAYAARDAMLKLPSQPDYVLLEGPLGQRQLDQVEKLLEALVRDGFEVVAAARCVTMIAELVHMHVRSVFALRGRENEPHRGSIVDALEQQGGRWPLLRAAVAEPHDAAAQFRFDVEAALDGLAKAGARQA
ncbi:TetR/AcrR family transcriptional regulator [Yinghuangia seranimata]|uniref:TetR/AcrR family transcriptional regulator n=1 Tax=Yinghuangia seranimata TaxID=408067 RepID=UPI00248BD399|nr:TetR/AcrR family transcriptional regulator C-terminal domain-containing protein [Yinghuangia seranimata]MDI2130124.1 TetR/AcrR family transcriptional regulator C-terminal domain-containing protein [Yinghuangia seranimata]